MLEFTMNILRATYEADRAHAIATGFEAIMRSLNNPMRCMQNRATGRALEMEARGAGLAELLTVVSGKIGRKMYARGDPEGVPIACGLGASLIHDIRPIAELVDEIVTGAHAILSRVRTMEKG